MLEELRKNKGFSQQTLGERIGRSKSFMSRLENNKSKQVTVETIVRLAEELEMDIIELFLIFVNFYIERRKEELENEQDLKNKTD
ncbi:helix-turn-helix domain-containing protein [Clostridium saccharobutylicum]|uniref:Transcriptional regulato n=1 Tax=Clostridium saccharobutylicum DSM 13864 TaxID=1345695 RepID=U5MRL8_CLOSA|nr:helix-turn-helix transcriptional regulator [Clostridium saccharobutylicum]AGX43255.1 transcriptional regulato [Clostridium saccharobutylicum DSM 13864]AQR90555.1 helix-turn-helix domain protein [Clostridium saccharobutylicum]AQS00459.1 helix-turn-helix domain protein [Clostridium saccharobutylicum]AQS10108.1 helix-turn-helix domain protein [Clostridium saccharobutylicum]AQS14442.1 helix-turn-helix domain protein [Clostridium saccharobutylicum]